MTTPLQGFRLQDGKYVLIEPDTTGQLECRELGLRFGLEDGQLVIRDGQNGDPLRTEGEAERAAREAAEARAAAAEEEVRRLREQLNRKGGDPDQV